MDSVISSRWRSLSQPRSSESPPRGLDRLWLQAAGRIGRLSRHKRHFFHQADRIQSIMEKYRRVSDGKLREMALAMREYFLLGRDTPDGRDRAFAMVGEVAARTVGLRPYREQMAAASALHAGCVAEMATGEGKTLAATLPAVLAGWRGRGCHILTANDYLVRRDADMMQPIYRFCGLTVGCVTQDMEAAHRRQAYNAHVTYGTGKEVAADYLRDRLLQHSGKGLPAVMLSKMAGEREDRVIRLVQRGLSCAIVDEADSVFIDDASTPLLISGDGANPAHLDAYHQAARLARGLDPSTDYRVARDQFTVSLTPMGRERLAESADLLGGLWTGGRRREELVVQALVADIMYIRDKHYVLDEDKVVIVDGATGRLMPDRKWRNGLHQAVEAKEGVRINLPQETCVRISFQRYFSLYRKLSGMSGTVAEARSELWGIYRLPVIAIPTHRSCRRTVRPDRVFATARAKWKAVIEDIREVHGSGRPILIGTGSIRESAQLSRRLKTLGLGHHLLNAVQEASEARIIAEAGQKGRITVSTNMAGRGTDIRLGPGVAALGGLHVIATERYCARRIDRQLAGRCARQGDPGSTQAFISLEDELFQNNSQMLAAALGRWCDHNDRECRSIFWRRLVNVLQRKAQRLSFRRRRDILSADNRLDRQLGFTETE